MRKLLGLIALFIVTLFFLLPSLAKTSFGNQTIVSLINREIPGTLSVENIDLSWFNGQELKDVSYQDGRFSLKLESLHIDTSLIKLIFKQTIKEFIVKGLEIDDSLKDGQMIGSLRDSTLFIQGGSQTFSIDGQIPLNLSEKNFNEAKVSIKNFPSVLIDKFLGRKIASEFFGKEIALSLNQGETQELLIESDNLKGNVNFTIQDGSVFSVGSLTGKSTDVRFSGHYGQDGGRFLLSFLSEHLQLENVQVAINDEITLQKRAPFHIDLEPATLVELLGISVEGESLKIDGNLEKFSCPIQFDLDKVRLKINFEASGVALVNGNCLLDEAKIDLELKKGIAEFEGAFKMEPKLPAPYHEIAGETFQVNTKGKFVLKDRSFEETLLNAESPSHRFMALFNYKEQMLQLLKPAFLELKIMPHYLQSFAFAKDGSFNLKKPVQVNLSLTPFDSKLRITELEQANLSGDIKMDLVDFFSFGNEFIVKDLSLPFELSSHKLKFRGAMKTTMPKFNKEGAIAGKVTLKGWGKAFKARLQLMNFPTDILSSYNISAFAGDSLSMELDAEYEKQLHIEAFVQGQDLTGTLSIHTDDNLTVISDETHAEFNFLLDQNKLNALAALAKKEDLEPHFTLLENTPAQLKISAVHLSLAKSFKELIAGMGLNLTFHVDKFLLNDLKRKQTIALQDLNFFIDTANLSDKLSFKLVALPQNDDRSKGSLAINGEISNLITKEGNWSQNLASIEAKVSALSFSTGVFCDLFCPYPAFSSKLEALFGNSIDGEMRLKIHQMTGPLSASIRGGNGMVKLIGKLDRGFLYLTEPLVAEVKATPLLGKHILKDIAPYLQGLESSNSLIRFTIRPEGFVFPVKDSNIEGIAIKEATLETGKLLFKNSPELSSLIVLLNGQLKEKETIWLTPIYFSMKEGKIKLKRADMLVADTYHFAAWGAVDLLNDKVDMQIGVAAGTISKALGIKGIGKGSMLQIPFKGPLSNPKIDKNKAAAKISSLVASNRGPEGKIIGTFIDIASGGLLEQDPPAPTTKPFPWGEIADNSEEEAPKSFPLDEIEKGSKKLIKKLFH